MKKEREVSTNLTISLAAAATSIVGVFYPPLALLSAAGLAYISVPFLKDGYHSLVKQKQVNVSVVESLLAICSLAMGYNFALALSCIAIYWGKKLVHRTEDNAYKSLIDVFGQRSDSVWIVSDDIEIEMPIERVKTGDKVVVHTGEMIPVDGKIVDGIASVDQRVLTGESQPVEKEAGDPVFASTVVLSGKLYIEVEKAGEETTVAKISQIWEKTADFKSSMRSRGEAMADQFAPMTLGLAGLALLTTGPMAFVTVLNASFAFHMRVLAPIGVLHFLNMASKGGILIKDGRVLDILKDVDTIVFDKTGTLTQEEPHVGGIFVDQVYGSAYSKQDILTYAAAAEDKQSHPIARSIIQAANQRQLVLPVINDAEYTVGYGLAVQIEGKHVHVGSMRFMNMENMQISSEMIAHQKTSKDDGCSLVMVAIDRQVVGAIEIHATVRPEAKETVLQLRQFADMISIISGDQEAPTRKLAQELEIDQYFAETLPEHKAQIIKQLQDEGKTVCYIGDGINDAIALKQANVSISLSGASTIATDTAQVVLMNQHLSQLVRLFEISRQFDETMNRAFLCTVLPNSLTVVGSFFFNFVLIQSMILSQSGLGMGLYQLFRPSYQKEDRVIEAASS
ncbi:MAG: heavy metal translocating P-type ATPase [Chloroflexota bacterium]